MNSIICLLVGMAIGALEAERIREIAPMLDPNKESQ